MKLKKKKMIRLANSSAADVIAHWYALEPGDYKIEPPDVIYYRPGRGSVPIAEILVIKANGQSRLIIPGLMQSPAPEEYIQE